MSPAKQSEGAGSDFHSLNGSPEKAAGAGQGQISGRGREVVRAGCGVRCAKACVGVHGCGNIMCSGIFKRSAQ